tara:strand:- start:256 stop:2247 length:1992 start_codon:yes stop_codon:yes gene_type:complete
LEVDMKSIRELLTVVDAYGQTLSEGPVYDMLIKNGATPANAKAMAQAQGETDLDDAQDTNLKSIITDLISPIEPRPTGNEEGDPYDLINSQQQANANKNDFGAQSRLDRAEKELKADQDAWDDEYSETHLADGTPKVVVDDGGNIERMDLRPGDTGYDAMQTFINNLDSGSQKPPRIITPQVQQRLDDLGIDKGIVGEPLTADDIAALDADSTGPDDGTRGGQEPNRPTDAELDTSNAALASNNPNTTFDSYTDAYNADNLKDGDIITIDGIEAEVRDAKDGDQQFFVHPGTNTVYDQPKPPAPQGELAATDTAQTATKTVAPGTGAGGPAGGAKEPAETPPEAQQSAGPDDGTRGGQEPNREPAAPSNGSLLGRKLDTATPNLMTAYNQGGKQAMPAIRNMQTALSRLGFDPNGIDGKYGNGTFKAVQAFQKANGLAVDGQAGPNTTAAIKKALDDKFEKNKVTPADSARAAQPRSNASGDPAEIGSTGVQPKSNTKPNSALNTTGKAPTTQLASKDNNMNKNKINEASMNISMNGQNAQEISDLMRMMQLAGAKEATPVSALHKGPVDGHDDMVSLMQIANDEHEGHDDSPCGMGEEGVEEEWDNSPNEEYGDLSDAIPAGDDMHKKKKAYAATQPGDNAMAVEAIKSNLRKAFEEALANK